MPVIIELSAILKEFVLKYKITDSVKTERNIITAKIPRKITSLSLTANKEAKTVKYRISCRLIDFNSNI